jgi:hypothetical protein
VEPSELLARVVRAFELLGISYFVTGSTASMYYGEPRFTNDIDFVADFKSEHVSSFQKLFPPDEFYLSEEGMKEAIRFRSMFNIIHPASGFKVDISVRAADAFDESRFARARKVELTPEQTAYFSSPEDIILKKMLFYREGGSEKHLRDIVGILLVSSEKLDNQYLAEWITRLKLEDIWQIIQKAVRREK